MKAIIQLGDCLINLPMSYLEQQTCSTTVFSGIPCISVDMNALILANKENRGVQWFKYGIRKELLQVTIPTELIKWEA